MAGLLQAGGDRLIRIDAPPLGHIPSFDGIRGVFMIQVVLHHALVTNFLDGSPILIDWFFVASGFLITALLLDEVHHSGDISLRRFYERRIRRLFPAMYSMLAVFTVLMFIATRLSPELAEDAPLWWLEPIGAAFYSYNIVAAFFPASIGIIGYMWSLAVEEQFYMMWPPVLRRWLRNASRRTDLILILGCVAFIATFFTLRWVLGDIVVVGGSAASPEYADQDAVTAKGVIYRIASTRPDMIVLGCLVAFLARLIPRPVPPMFRRVLAAAAMFGWVWLAVVLLFCAPGPPSAFALFGGPVYQIGLLLLAPIVLDGYLRPRSWYARILSLYPIRWLGQRAYGVYVWHGVVLLSCAPIILSFHGMQRRLVGLFVSVFAIAAGVASYRFLEQRFLRPRAVPRAPSEAGAS